ncbi:MAG: hypothetical protein H6828_06235 [Planctomycetes bacterium]|nr:hypothetical protein [Planctomycetota bacterium]
MTISEPIARETAGPAQRLSDLLNPILVKEVRQSLRGRYFKVSFWVTLTIATLVGLAVLLFTYNEAQDMGLDTFGAPFFIAMLSCLVLATQVLVPFSAFLSMGSEWDENTYDLLVLSNLRPRQIVLGKVLSAFVQALLFYAAFGPFLVFAFLLRGLDIVAIFTVLGMSTVASLLLSSVAVAMSSFGRGRFVRLLLMVVLAVLLVWTSFGTVFAGAGLTFSPTELYRPETQQAIGATLSIAFAVALFFFAAACARLAHPEENRSTGLRLMTLVVIAIGLGWMTWIMGAHFEDEPALASVCLAHAVLAATTLFFVTEPERLGRRVTSGLPRFRLLRLLEAPFLPGGGRGLLFFLVGSALVNAWAYLYPLIAVHELHYDKHEVLVPPAVTLYGLIYLGVPSALFSLHSDSVVARTVARVVTLCAFFAGLLLPALFGFLFGLEQWARFRHPLHVFLAVEDVWEGRGRVGGVWPFLIVGGAVALALNTPRLWRALREVLARPTTPREEG